MATTSYLEAVSGGMVAAAAFSDDDAAVQAVTLLRESGVREQDICVLANNSQRADLVSGGRAWLPGKGWGGLRYRLRNLLPGGIIPKEDMEELQRRGMGKLFGPGTSTSDLVDYIREWFEEHEGAGARSGER